MLMVLLLQGQIDLKVKQLEEAQSGTTTSGRLRQPEASSRRSLPSTPSETSSGSSLGTGSSWSMQFNLTKELEEARKQLRLKDQEILQLRAQVPKKLPASCTPPQQLTSPEMEAKLFKSSLQIAERSKTSSISFVENKVGISTI